MSYKAPNGRCVAGKEILDSDFGAWVRPVSKRAKGELCPLEYRYSDNQVPRLLDVIELELLSPRPELHQTENHIISPSRRWIRKDRLTWSESLALQDFPAQLWTNRGKSPSGFNDRCTPTWSAPARDSLLLIQTKDLHIIVGRSRRDAEKKSFRADFRYSGVPYNLSLTDPTAINAFKRNPAGVYPVGEALLCVSLTMPYEHDGKCHKLVAGVVTPQPLT